MNLWETYKQKHQLDSVLSLRKNVLLKIRHARLCDLVPVVLNEVPSNQVASKVLADGFEEQRKVLCLDDLSIQTGIEKPESNNMGVMSKKNHFRHTPKK